MGLKASLAAKGAAQAQVSFVSHCVVCTLPITLPISPLKLVSQAQPDHIVLLAQTRLVRHVLR